LLVAVFSGAFQFNLEHFSLNAEVGQNLPTFTQSGYFLRRSKLLIRYRSMNIRRSL
jgi:hypothetical protein